MSLLRTAFIKPESVLSLDLPQWSQLIRHARRANVLARLGFYLKTAGILEKIPAQPLLHIKSSLTFAKAFECSLQWEIHCIEAALKPLDIPLVFLKGSAYYVAGNSAAKGRIFSDIDILVPENRLLEVEVALINAGWITSTLDPYDQKYYRQWMHEIPPMRHLRRQTSIDVHHNILPKTCKFSPDANKLLANTVQIPGTNAWVLAPEDRILHSATHLFNGGEFEQGFRDLSDLDLLLKEFASQENFWTQLRYRAEVLNQQTALCYALRYTNKILNTPIPPEILNNAANRRNAKLSLFFLDLLFVSALQPGYGCHNNPWTEIARFCLFVRSHWLKMPVSLLLPHLLKKSLKQMNKLIA
ncbi:nucleotidyltransferase domain-containing protein [Methylovulum miyakonense]|uniref:nucleotidyltransferase domain-containing protein n=1 Tax=Methylovulum miyakonense TaxID=645578 RepID=UPI0005907ACB|nr:nucleotidyltransferase family protein [Methylovulum miyakonense]